MSFRSALDREAYAVRIDREPGYSATLRPSLTAPPDVRLTDRCGQGIDAFALPAVVLKGADLFAESACNCCRPYSRAAGWPGLFASLVEVTGREPLNIGSVNDQLARLTRREREVLQLVGVGKSVGECAESLGVSPSTVGNHKYRLMRKLGVTTSLQLLRIAVRHGLAEI